MIRQILKSWQENRGNLLVLLGSLAGLMMSLIWYFDLVPEVRLMARGIPGTVVSSSPRPSSTSLVAIVRVPAHHSANAIAASGADSGESLRAVVELYSPHDFLAQQTAPLLVQSVALRDDGVPVAVVFGDLQPGRYGAVAFVDINGSGSFDASQAESEDMTEPFCLARAFGKPKSADSSSGDIPSAENAANGTTEEPLPPGIFEVSAAQATLVMLDFDELP